MKIKFLGLKMYIVKVDVTKKSTGIGSQNELLKWKIANLKFEKLQ